MQQLLGSRLLPIATAVCLTVPSALALGGDRLYSVSPFDANLRLIDPLTAKTLTTIRMTTPGSSVLQATGLAAHPTTGELWALILLTGNPTRFLAKVDATTGVATVIGNTGDRFAGIAFDGAGTLYGVTGDGATNPETLYTLSLTTGAPTLVMALGNGRAGETMAFHPRTGLILHASGDGQLNVDEILETVDPVRKVVTNVPLSGDNYTEALAMTWWVGDNFLVSDIPNDFYLVSASGTVRMLGTLDHNAKGLAFVPRTNTAHFKPYGSGCPASRGHVGVLAGSGTPSPGNPITVGALNGPSGASAVLLMGLGQSTLAISPACSIQNVPVLSFVIPVVLSAGGSASLPMQIPPGTLPGDIYFQLVPFEGVTPLVTNPLQIHIQ